jgi:hypothetical protein
VTKKTPTRPDHVGLVSAVGSIAPSPAWSDGQRMRPSAGESITPRKAPVCAASYDEAGRIGILLGFSEVVCTGCAPRLVRL